MEDNLKCIAGRKSNVKLMFEKGEALYQLGKRSGALCLISESQSVLLSVSAGIWLL